MKNDRFRWIFLLALALCLAFAPLARAQEVEVEPNHPCSAAQDITVSSSLTIDGSIDTPDVDFYRISAPPGSVLRVSLEGASSGQGTLPDPILGAYSEDCSTFLRYDDDSGAGLNSFFELPAASGTVVLAAGSYGDFSFSGYGYYSGSYRLTVEQDAGPARSISGRAVDSETGSPLSGANVALSRCHDGYCGEFVGWAYTDFQGGFLFENGAFNVYSPLTAGDYQVRIERYNYEVAQVGFSVSGGEELDLGDIGLVPFPRVGSIRGRLIDAVTGAPLPGYPEPYAWIELLYCDWFHCSTVRYVSVGPDGTFLIEGDAFQPLLPGTYKIFVHADQYESAASEPFEVANREHFDLGDFAVKSFPVRIYLDQPCGPIPAAGGSCQFKMRVVNGSPSRFVGEAWSIVSGNWLGTPAGYTTFQTGNPRGISLASGASATVPLSFFVPAEVSNGAYICAEGFAALRPHSFNTLGRHYLLCLVKGAYGFSVVPEEHKRDAVRRMKGEQPPHPRGRR